jgi:hypothetical protein
MFPAENNRTRTHYVLMALFQTRSAAVFGIEAHLIDVEVDMYNGSARDFVSRFGFLLPGSRRSV